MTTIVLKDWYYENCVTYPVTGSWFLNWGIAIVPDSKSETVGAYRTLKGEIERETEKAIYFTCRASRFDSRCNITKTVKWHMWLPKKGIISDAPYMCFNGGEGAQVDACMFKFLNEHKSFTSVKTWAFK